MRNLGCAAAFAAAVVIAEPALAADPFAGTWVLDVAKSRYSPGPAPAPVTVTTRDIGNGKFDTAIDVTGQDGKAMHFEVVYANDGTDYPIAGPVPGETVSSKYAGARTLETTFKIDGKSMATTTQVVAADLSTLTSTTAGTTPSGAPIRNSQMYERKTIPASN
jgi:hypothetical protein